MSVNFGDVSVSDEYAYDIAEINSGANDAGVSN